MNDLLIELRQLDINQAGNWPVPIKIGALAILFIAIIIAGHFFVWQEQTDTLEKIRAEEETLKNTYLIKKRSAVNLPALRVQLGEIEQSLSAMLKQLPDKSEMEALLIDINQAGLGRGLQFELFKPGQEQIKDFYAELPITVKINGGYHDFGAFAADIAKLPRIVTLNNISIAPTKEGGLLSMDATTKTFRYLDPEEVQAQRKPAR